MVNFCAAYGCTNEYVPQIALSFFSFPFKRPEILECWIKAIRREKWKPSKTSKLCSEHFLPSDFQDRPGSTKKFLKPDAIPSIFSFPKHLQKKTVLPRRREVCSEEPMDVDISPTEEEPTAIASKTFVSCTTQCTILKPRNGPLRRLRREVKTLKQKVKRRDLKISNMKDIIREIRNSGYSNENLDTVLKNYFEGLPLELVLLKKRDAELKNTGQRRYSPLMKQFAHTLYFYSANAYHFLRKHFILPNGRTIRKWLRSINCEPGILNEVLEFLKHQVEGNKYLKNCALIVDAMSIRKQVVWDHSAGKFAGSVNYGGIVEVDYEMAASEALFFQIVSFSKKFKCPVAYFLTNKCDANLQTQLITSCIRSLYECGIIIRSITSDGAQTNISTYKNLGCNLDAGELKPNFPHPNAAETMVHCELDACHMVKIARNTFAEKNLTSPSGKIDWSYIRKLDELQEKEGLRLANSLSSHHVNYKNKIMNVRLAVQCLSSGVADALEYLENCNIQEFKGCAATVQFIRKIDRVFDILNSRNPYDKGFKAPIRPDTIKYFKEVFSDTVNYLKSLKIDDIPILNHSRKTFALGLIITMQSTLNLAKDLFSLKEEPLKYFLTYKTSQDHIELFFSCIRSRGGWNNNPNSQQLKWALRQLLLRNSVTPSLSSNCSNLEDYCSPAFDFRSDKRGQGQRKEINENENIEEMMEYLGQSTLSDFKQNILYYIAGYIIKSITNQSLCDYCVDILLYREDCINDHQYCQPKESFRKFNTFATRGGLLHASNIVFEIISFTEKQFQFFIRNENILNSNFHVKRKLSNSAIKYFSSKRNKFLPSHPVTEEFLSEESHEVQLIRKITELFIKCRMHHYSKLFSMKILGKSASVRQKMTKLILFKNC